MTLEQRAESYSLYFPNYPKIMVDKGWLYGIWQIGNYYKRKYDYYGSYPPSYLKRIYSLFPDKTKLLHLFSGAIDDNESNDGI